MLDSKYSLTTERISEAAGRIRKYGFVVIKQAVPHDLLDILRDRMDRDTEELLDYCNSIGGNPRERGHLQQGPPPTRDFVFKDVAMNSWVTRVCDSLFGKGAMLTFYNGNTNCPGSIYQRLHMDDRPAQRPNEEPPPTRDVVINISPADANESNGAVQLWPGSHQEAPAAGLGHIQAPQEQARQASDPPIQAITSKGDVLIRDVRLWHRGVPNPSNKPRHMIALVISSKAGNWAKGKLKFEHGCESALEGNSILSNAEYVDSVGDYLIGPSRRIYENRLKQESKSASA